MNEKMKETIETIRNDQEFQDILNTLTECIKTKPEKILAAYVGYAQGTLFGLYQLDSHRGAAISAMMKLAALEDKNLRGQNWMGD